MAKATTWEMDYGTDTPVNDAYLLSWPAGAIRLNNNPTTLATGLIGWACTVAGHPGTWIPLYVIAGGSFVPAPDSYTVAVVDYDAIIANGTGGFGTASDATGAFGYAASTGVPATDMATALTAAKLTPFKTLERVGKIMPRYLNGGTLVVMAKPRTAGATYRNMANTVDQPMTFLNHICGGRFVFRASRNFANDSDDKITCGFQIAGTTNATGYNCTAGATTLALGTCQLNGGGAPAFPAESTGFSAISGKRIRFDAATTTASLRNATTMVWKNTTTSITLASALAAAPVAADIFYIEEPGLRIGSFTHNFGGVHNAGLNQPTPPYFTLAGIAATATGSQYVSFQGNVNWSGLELAAVGALAPALIDFGRLDARNTYVDEVGATISLGVACRSAGNWFVQDGLALFYINGCELGVTGHLFFAVGHVDVGRGCFLRSGVFSDGGTGGPGHTEGGTNFVATTSVGKIPSITASQRLRITNNPASADRGAVDMRIVSGASIQGIDFSNITRPLVKLATQSGRFEIDDLVSPDGGNTDVVLDLTKARDTNAVCGTLVSNTATASAGDIRLAGSVIAPMAGLSLTNYRDNQSNNVTGAAESVT